MDSWPFDAFLSPTPPIRSCFIHVYLQNNHNYIIRKQYHAMKRSNCGTTKKIEQYIIHTKNRSWLIVHQQQSINIFL
jgi:hypothetical protein